jgi:hypothetical protein
MIVGAGGMTSVAVGIAGARVADGTDAGKVTTVTLGVGADVGDEQAAITVASASPIVSAQRDRNVMIVFSVLPTDGKDTDKPIT